MNSNQNNANPETLYAKVPTSDFGALIEISREYPLWLTCKKQQFNELIITFQDQDGYPLKMEDSRVSGILLLRITKDSIDEAS